MKYRGHNFNIHLASILWSEVHVGREGLAGASHSTVPGSSSGIEMRIETMVECKRYNA